MNHWYYHYATIWREVFPLTVKLCTAILLGITLYLIRKRIMSALIPRSVPELAVYPRSRSMG